MHKELSPEEAKSVLEKSKQERAQKCQEEIQKVLDKYNCFLDVSVLVKANSVIPSVAIVARD